MTHSFQTELSECPHILLLKEQEEALRNAGVSKEATLETHLEFLECHKFRAKISGVLVMVGEALRDRSDREEILQTPLSRWGISTLLSMGIISPAMLDDVIEGLEEARAEITAYVTMQYFSSTCLKPCFDQLRREGKAEYVEKIEMDILPLIRTQLVIIDYISEDQPTTLDLHVEKLNDALEKFQTGLQKGELGFFPPFVCENLPWVLEAIIKGLAWQKENNHVYGLSAALEPSEEGEFELVPVYGDHDEDDEGGLALLGDEGEDDDEELLEQEAARLIELGKMESYEELCDSPAGAELLNRGRNAVLKSIVDHNQPEIKALKDEGKIKPRALKDVTIDAEYMTFSEVPAREQPHDRAV